MYKLFEGLDGILKIDGTRITSIPNDLANRDWQEYQAWLALGNEPDPAD